jgi:hypothetical protein
MKELKGSVSSGVYGALNDAVSGAVRDAVRGEVDNAVYYGAVGGAVRASR